MTQENRAKLVKLFLIMKLHEAELREIFTNEGVYIRELERETISINELSKAQDKYYAIDDALSYIGDVIENIGSALGVEDITAADFGRAFISIEDTMPDEKQEVFVLFENGKICVSSWRYSKVRKKTHFAYEEIYGEAKGWLPIEESEV